MENKYYTPKIEEFHVGFEYEFMHPDDENKIWEKYSSPEFNHELENFCLSKYDRDHFRVKNLDRQDIESLGFKFQPVSFDTSWMDFTFYVDDESNYKLNFRQQDNIVNVYDNEDVSIFIGTIKNKSELIKVVEMLGIK